MAQQSDQFVWKTSSDVDSDGMEFLKLFGEMQEYLCAHQQEWVGFTEQLLQHFFDFIKDHPLLESEECFHKIQEFLNESRTDELLRDRDLSDSFYRRVRILRQYDFLDFRRHYERRIVVSLTTYPARIAGISTVLETIYTQTRRADEVVLWLADTQFPGREADLPAELLELAAAGRLTIRWCRDLRPHKKYYYAVQEYPDDLIVTIDDDLYYDPDVLEDLFESYLCWPNAVSACRTHMIAVTKDGSILPYGVWIKESDLCLCAPCMQLLATGGAGTLYPPHLFDPCLVDEDALMCLCPDADDLWLKAMQLLSDVPVVLARANRPLVYVDGSQESALWHQNVGENANDRQWMEIVTWADANYGKGILSSKLTDPDSANYIVGVKALCERMYTLRCAADERLSQTGQKRCDAQLEKLEARSRLQQVRTERREKKAQVRKLRASKDVLKQQLESARREKQIRAMQIAELKKEQKQLENSLAYRIRRIFKILFRKTDSCSGGTE